MFGSALRICVLSLTLLGAPYVPVAASQNGLSPESQGWQPGQMRSLVGVRERASNVAALKLDEQGRASIEVDGRQLQLEDLPLLHLSFDGRPDVLAMVISWRSDETGRAPNHVQIGLAPGSSFWFNLSESPGWRGSASKLGVTFYGPAGGEVRVDSIALHTNTFPSSLFAVLSQWTYFVPWSAASINSHLGLSMQGFAPMPVPAFFTGFLVLTIPASLISILLWRSRKLALVVVASLFFGCWLLLDLLWQYKLLRQSELSLEELAGRPLHERRLRSQDAAVYQLAEQVKGAIPEADARVFVTSISDYGGMRSSYFLYPKNVFWQRHANTLPAAKHLRSGDYVVLVPPTSVRFDSDAGTLSYGVEQLSVRQVLALPTGSLFRVL